MPKQRMNAHKANNCCKCFICFPLTLVGSVVESENPRIPYYSVVGNLDDENASETRME